jgi:hypothetical protein
MQLSGAEFIPSNLGDLSYLWDHLDDYALGFSLA